MSVDRLRQLLSAGRFEDVRQAAIEFLQEADDPAPLWCLKSSAELELLLTEAAVESASAAVAAAPEDPLCHYTAGLALIAHGLPGGAASAFSQALALKPSWVSATLGLASAQIKDGAAGEALNTLESLGEDPIPEALRLIAEALFEFGDLEDALAMAERARESLPDSVELLYLQARILRDLGRIDAARMLLEESASADSGVQRMAATIALDQGDAEKAANLLRDGAATDAHSAGLFAFVSNYIQGLLPAVSLAAHSRAAAFFDAATTPPPQHQPRGNRKLRIGLVSGDFKSHAIMYFLFPLLEELDRDKFEVILYYTQTDSDAHTIHSMALADGWRNIADDSDVEAAGQIRADALDILIDCSGWTAGHRLGVFQLKPAPVQATWLGYPNTTGMSAIDYRLTDRISDPPGPEAHEGYAEALRYLPRGFLCFQGDPDVPVAPAPCALSEGIALGSYNALGKLTEPTVALWAEILNEISNATLVLKAQSLADEETAARTVARFTAQGVDPSRIDCRPQRNDTDGALHAYADIDIALDPFPYNGTTTTCEALWMGVPVVTLRGSSHAGRVGASLLTQLGASSWIADNPDAYREIVKGLAAKPAQLASLRQRLRPRFQASPLADAKGFTRSFEACLRTMIGRR